MESGEKAIETRVGDEQDFDGDKLRVLNDNCGIISD